MAAGSSRFKLPIPAGPVRKGRAAPGRVLAPALLLMLGACAIFEAPQEPRGNRVDAEQLREITPGVQTRQDVQALLGSPSTTGAFSQNRWLYVSSTSRIRPGRVPGIENQRVVEITFDDAGVVRGVREVPTGDMRDIAVVERETPVPGNDRTLLQSLLGNVGRFGAAGTTGGDGPGGGPGSGR